MVSDVKVLIASNCSFDYLSITWFQFRLFFLTLSSPTKINWFVHSENPKSRFWFVLSLSSDYLLIGLIDYLLLYQLFVCRLVGLFAINCSRWLLYLLLSLSLVGLFENCWFVRLFTLSFAIQIKILIWVFLTIPILYFSILLIILVYCWSLNHLMVRILVHGRNLCQSPYQQRTN